MLNSFYSDLRDFEMGFIKEKEDKAKEEEKKGEAPKWHKALSISNPIESIEEEKTEPRKPQVPQVHTDFKREKDLLESDLQKQHDFICGLMCLSRED
mmetsp:Transcript_39496/g.37961  ORF Transcript_39496/g.37961 Transcript_39496/m.37961 type:complete len:97 (-) Transcript_39496:3306-3596(-)